jgi:hypothetical protein
MNDAMKSEQCENSTEVCLLSIGLAHLVFDGFVVATMFRNKTHAART